MSISSIGMIGLGVMGRNLALNLRDHGVTVVGYDLSSDNRARFDAEMGASASCATIAELASRLPTPRRIMLLVPAGKPVDDVIASLRDHLAPGDILIDGGNSHYKDTQRRYESLAAEGIHFIGMGVSGGEEGARTGPAMMAGGAVEAWSQVRAMFESIAARADDGAPCCAFVGPGGAGHFVKMVHNGIEYADMQLISEAYWLMRKVANIAPAEQATIFREWSEGDLSSYLIDITADILASVDERTGKPMVDVILDTAGQKGTGKWTSQVGLDLGAPIPTIAEAVFARCLSAVKDERAAASRVLRGPAAAFTGDPGRFVDAVRDALYASKICTYAQGFQLLRYASDEYKWGLDYGTIAGIWRAGCIIRAQFLDHITRVFTEDPATVNLLLREPFLAAIRGTESAWRSVIAIAATLGVPVPAFSSALAYFDGYRSAVLPANLLQAQRDYFGAHRFERTDAPRGETFHREWTQ